MPRSDIGELIRERRSAARLSQLDLSLEIGVSARHLGFVELGRSRPSPELVERIGQHLDVPLRDRNDWLMAAGYAPKHAETPLEADGLRRVTRSLQTLLDAHDPYPAAVIDRRWSVQLTNQAGIAIARSVPDDVRGTPTNIFRISLHPDGLAPRTRNFGTWSRYLLGELERAIRRTDDQELRRLAEEVETWPDIPPRAEWSRPHFSPDRDPVATWQVEVDGVELSFFTTLSVFAAPLDVTLSELAIELFFPADDATEAALRA